MKELDSESSFDDWFQSEIKWIVDPAWMDVRQAIEGRLADLNRSACLEEGVDRDRWDIFAPCPIKSAARVRSKIVAGGEPPTCLAELRSEVLALGDLARLRVVASLKRDVDACVRAFFPDGFDRMLDRFPVLVVKDFVRDEAQRRALAGHRAIQFVVQVPGTTDVPRVEVQIMTALQHAWDRRNHCVYEWLRSGDESRRAQALEVRIDDHAIAETLHVVDALADHNFEKFLRMRREAP
jgi:ppGpp synthetase/RelA/SpoT-type nucleotidyltranferase